MPDASVIRNGTFRGECLVHCDETVEVTADAVRYTLTSRVPDARRPDIDVTEPLAGGRFGQLAAAADPQAFAAARPANALPADAADEGGEFVEIVPVAGAPEHLTFAAGADMPALGALLGELRALRAELARRHRG